MDVDPKLAFFALILLAVAFEVAGDVLLKKWAAENHALLLALAVYFVGTVFWAFSLKHEYLSKAVAVFTVLNLAAVALAGVVLFHEELSLAQKAGVALGILSVALLEL